MAIARQHVAVLRLRLGVLMVYGNRDKRRKSQNQSVQKHCEFGLNWRGLSWFFAKTATPKYPQGELNHDTEKCEKQAENRIFCRHRVYQWCRSQISDFGYTTKYHDKPRHSTPKNRDKRFSKKVTNKFPRRSGRAVEDM